jgi:hypothetical protein
VEGKTRIRKNNEVIAGHLSPCVQIFIESLLNAELTTDEARDTGTTENSIDIKIKKQSTRLSSERGE